MKKASVLRHEFVEYIPQDLSEGIIYVSIPFATVVHKCCCGCGNEVVTPLSPTDWKLTFDGESISLFPSIGNWSFPCRSHYWVRGNRVEWAAAWSRQKINAARADELIEKSQYYAAQSVVADPVQKSSMTEEAAHKANLLQRLKELLFPKRSA